MRNLALPKTIEEWDALAPAIVRANLELAGMNYIELAVALNSFGLRQNNKIISSKLNKGRFSATFFLQTLVAAGVDHIRLPMNTSGRTDANVR